MQSSQLMPPSIERPLFETTPLPVTPREYDPIEETVCTKFDHYSGRLWECCVVMKKMHDCKRTAASKMYSLNLLAMYCVSSLQIGRCNSNRNSQ